MHPRGFVAQMARGAAKKPKGALTVSGRRCLDEFNVFMRAGLPGFDRLQAVYGSIFKHFNVHSPRERAELLLLAGVRATGPKGLEPVHATSFGWGGRAMDAEEADV